MDTKVTLNTARLDELLAEGASSPAIRTLIADAFLSLQQLGIIVKTGASAEPSKSEPAHSAHLPP